MWSKIKDLFGKKEELTTTYSPHFYVPSLAESSAQSESRMFFEKMLGCAYVNPHTILNVDLESFNVFHGLEQEDKDHLLASCSNIANESGFTDVCSYLVKKRAMQSLFQSKSTEEMYYHRAFIESKTDKT